MTPFTDEDLALLMEGRDIWPTVQEFGADDSTIVIPRIMLQALLSRLEAAEKVCNVEHGCVDDSSYCCAQFQVAHEAWRKAAGK